MTKNSILLLSSFKSAELPSLRSIETRSIKDLAEETYGLSLNRGSFHIMKNKQCNIDIKWKAADRN